MSVYQKKPGGKPDAREAKAHSSSGSPAAGTSQQTAGSVMHSKGRLWAYSELIEGLDQLMWGAERRELSDRKQNNSGTPIEVEPATGPPGPEVGVQLVRLRENLQKWLMILQASGKMIDVVAGTLLIVIGSMARPNDGSDDRSDLNQQPDLLHLFTLGSRLIQELSSTVQKT